MIRQFIKDESGGTDSHINALFYFTVVITIMYAAFQIIPPLVQYMQLINYATTVKNVVEINGEINYIVEERMEEIESLTTSVDDVSFAESNFIYGTQKIQLNERIVVIVKKQIIVGRGSFFEFPLEMIVKREGASQAFWKE